MADVSQVMRIALTLDDAALRPGASRLAAAVDLLPFRPSSPEAMATGAHSFRDVAVAHHHASVGLSQLVDLPGFARANAYGRVEEGVRQLGRLLDAGDGSPIADDLIRGAVHRFDDTVRALGSPGSY